MQNYDLLMICIFFGLVLNFLMVKALSKCCISTKEHFLVPENYDKNQAPLEAEDKPTIVYINIDIMDIDEITEERMEYSMQFYVNEYWKDPRLNITFKSKSAKIPRDAVEVIWTPDIIFENSKGGWVYALAVPNVVVQTHEFGYLRRFTRYNMKISCPMFLQTYPMDTQRCALSISSSNDNSVMALKWLHERDKGESVEIPDLYYADIHTLKYYVANVTTSKLEFKWTHSDGTWTALRANFTFVRHLSSHIFNMYIPSSLVVVLSFMSFWLNVRSVPARVALGLTSLLTLSTQASHARKHLPPINYLTALDVWLFSCLLQVFLSLIEYATVYHMYSGKVHNKNSSRKAWTRNDGRHIISSELSINRQVKRFVKPQGEPTSSKEPLGADFDEEIQRLDKVSRFLFPLGFVIFAFVYWIVYLRIL